MGADPAGELLRAATGYAVARLRDVATPSSLAAALGQPLPADGADLAAVAAHLTSAASEADTALAAATADPPDIASAGTSLWAALAQVRAAAALLATPDPAPHLRTLIAQHLPAGAVSTLGLADPTVAWTDRALTLTWRTSAPPALVPGTRLRRVALTVAVGGDGDGGGGALTATLSLAGLGLDLVGAADGAPNVVLSTIVGEAARITADVDLTASRHGLRTHGSSGPVSIPATADVGIAALDDLRLSVRPEGGAVAIALTGRLTGSLGPLAAVVDGVETVIVVDPVALLDGTPLPPPRVGAPVRGIGLSLDTGLVTGGGYLAPSPPTGAGGAGYGGALQLRLGPVDVKAFGLLRERGGETSFVAVMSVELNPAVELGLGFTLNGVGGILGHGVTINTTPLAKGLKDGIIGRLLFPPDPVAAAPQILGTLGEVFPARDDGFVIGPMLALGWGRPTLVRLDVAVALALPDPVVVVLGRARAAFPTADAAVIDLRASLLAQFGGGMVLVRAELETSRVGFASVQGGFGILARFGGDPTFVVSAGGFHPRYTKVPGELAGLSRISSELAPPIGFQMRISGYVALTPNTLQLGGRIEVAYTVLVAAVRGSLEINAIVQFNPFGFELDLLVKVGVEALGHSVAGVDLALNLRGPSPWCVKGTGRLRLPWPLPDPSISVGPIIFGDPAPPTPRSTVRPLPRIARAFDDATAWMPRARPGFTPPVTLAPLPRLDGADAGRTPIEPWALLQATQRVAPLGMRLDRVGPDTVDPPRCTVRIAGDPLVGGEQGATWSQVREAFATAAFLDLTDDQALDAPDFEDRTAGLVIDPSGSRPDSPAGVEATMTYEDVHPFETFRRPRRTAWWAQGLSVQVALDATASGASALRAANRYAEVARPLTVRPASAVRVADLATNATVTTPDPADTGLDDGFAPWSDAAATASDVALSTLHLTKTGV
ncbi:hypothetical protein GCM10023153_08130 [Ornithinibacter aureus]|uniref:DUF6603 domain-containing protein n=1 Tax=Ornithinibacter aureus TaxID=622664 RepID=A0ABP8JHT1_9MICO|nr:DUF6603 domain-containing protein [Ornithinibacter aureus]KAF0833203.1 hypothetical protein C8E84_0981 [Ornithinibacter aureus]